MSMMALRAAIAARRAFRELDRKALAGSVDADSYFAVANRMHAACDVLAEQLSLAPDEGFALRAYASDGRMFLLNASAQRVGKWQLTTFARDGEPWSDTQYPRKLQAVRILLEDCELMTLADMDGEFASSRDWARS